MNGMLIELQNRKEIRASMSFVKLGELKIGDSSEWPERPTEAVACYETEFARDRAWAMLENAIATGVRLFRFPTDAEVELLIPFAIDPAPEGWERRGNSWVWRVRVPANDRIVQTFRVK